MVNIQYIRATIDGAAVALAYNTETGAYEATAFAPGRAGTFTVEFTAFDQLGNSATVSTELSVYKTVEESLEPMCLNLLRDGYYLELTEELCCV